MTSWWRGDDILSIDDILRFSHNLLANIWLLACSILIILTCFIILTNLLCKYFLYSSKSNLTYLERFSMSHQTFTSNIVLFHLDSCISFFKIKRETGNHLIANCFILNSSEYLTHIVCFHWWNLLNLFPLGYWLSHSLSVKHCKLQFWFYTYIIAIGNPQEFSF